MSRKKNNWQFLQLYSLRAVLDTVAASTQVRIYPSRKHEGVIMVKATKDGYEFSGQIKIEELPQLQAALKGFSSAPDKLATIYARDTQPIETRLYLEYVIVAIETFGWSPVHTSSPTWRKALELYTDRQPLSQTAIARADEIIAGMVQPEESDYGRRLARILLEKTVSPGSLAMLASASVALDRRRAREAAAAASKHVGVVGQGYHAEYLEVIHQKWVDTKNGPVRLYKLRDAQNNQFTCWREEWVPSFSEQMAVLNGEQAEPGPELPRRFAADVLIVAHQQYEGVKETVIRIDPKMLRSLEICPVCGGRYDQDACTCILEPSLYDFDPEEFDIEIEER